MLANPRYLNYLATQKFFDNEEFLAYLQYLQYFRQPKYIRYLQYDLSSKHEPCPMLMRDRTDIPARLSAHSSFCRMNNSGRTLLVRSSPRDCGMKDSRQPWHREAWSNCHCHIAVDQHQAWSVYQQIFTSSHGRGIHARHAAVKFDRIISSWAKPTEPGSTRHLHLRYSERATAS